MGKINEKLSQREINEKIMWVDIHYILPQRDNRIFVYMHGLFGNKNSSKWQEILSNALEKERWTARFSFRGNWWSQDENFWFENMTMNTMADDVKNIVEFLRNKGDYNFTMIASSLWASALIYALKKYPEIRWYTKNIVMLAPSLEFAKNKQSIWEREWDKITEKKWKEQWYLKTYHFTNEVDEKFNYDLFSESLELDLIDTLKKIEKPITIIGGRKDDIIGFLRLDEIAQENENITLIAVHDGHRLKDSISVILNNTIV